MKSQIDAITRFIEMGYRAYTGKVDAVVYETLNCPEPIFAKWLYNNLNGEKAVCVGCNKECQVNDSTGFDPPIEKCKSLNYNQIYTISPMDMIKRHIVLNAKQAAYCLNVSERAIYNMIAEGKLVKMKEFPVRVRSEEVLTMLQDFDE